MSDLDRPHDPAHVHGHDPVRARLDRVAGVSRRTPRAEYAVEGLSFGAAKLKRNPGHGRWESLILTLTPEASAESERAGGSRATPVYYPLEYWLACGSSPGDDEDDDVPAGLHALLVEHGLLSSPAWLTDAAPPALPADAAAALDGLRTVLARVTGMDVKCPVCGPARGGRAVRGGRYGRGPGDLPEQASLLRMLGLSIADLYDEPAGPSPGCPHAAMRREAFGALCGEFPELAFEAALVLVAAPTMSPPRYVLSPLRVKSLLDTWLVQRVLPAVDDPPRRAVLPPPVPEDAALSPGQRGALAFAAQSWGYDGAPGRFVPPVNAAGDMPAMAAGVALPDVARLWPDTVAKPAPRPAGEPAGKAPRPSPKTARTARAPRPPKTTETTETTEVEAATESQRPPAPTPGQQLMTSELRALGYGDARVRQLLKDGTLERAGFGWYRWKG